MSAMSIVLVPLTRQNSASCQTTLLARKPKCIFALPEPEPPAGYHLWSALSFPCQPPCTPLQQNNRAILLVRVEVLLPQPRPLLLFGMGRHLYILLPLEKMRTRV